MTVKVAGKCSLVAQNSLSEGKHASIWSHADGYHLQMLPQLLLRLEPTINNLFPRYERCLNAGMKPELVNATLKQVAVGINMVLTRLGLIWFYVLSLREAGGHWAERGEGEEDGKVGRRSFAHLLVMVFPYYLK